MDSGSTAGSSRDFQAEGLFRFGKPGIVSKRATAIKSTLGCGKLLVSLWEFTCSTQPADRASRQRRTSLSRQHPRRRSRQ